MSLPSLSPAEPAVESSPDAQEGGLDAAKPERAEGAERTEGAKALWPARQNLPPACATAPPSGKEDQSSSGEVGTQEGLASEPPQGEEEGKAEEKAAVESEDKAAVESDQEEHLVSLSEMIPYITCTICKGYLIDATTITECLHTFCKSCIVKHFEHSNRCPKCNITVHEAKPHNNLRMDPQLQNIVYKLVAGLEEKEKKQRREFYKENCLGTPKPAAVPQPGPSSEENTKDVVE